MGEVTDCHYSIGAGRGIIKAQLGFNYLRTLLESQGRRIEVINESEGDKEELMQDLIAIITSFVVCYYGQRRAKRKTEKIIRELKENDGNAG